MPGGPAQRPVAPAEGAPRRCLRSFERGVVVGAGQGAKADRVEEKAYRDRLTPEVDT
jgi:hypothetical protein